MFGVLDAALDAALGGLAAVDAGGLTRRAAPGPPGAVACLPRHRPPAAARAAPWPDELEAAATRQLVQVLHLDEPCPG